MSDELTREGRHQFGDAWSELERQQHQRMLEKMDETKEKINQGY